MGKPVFYCGGMYLSNGSGEERFGDKIPIGSMIHQNVI
jgi:hypothetical protein